MSSCIPGLFVTGTDTGVGKTYIGAMIARSLVAGGRRVGVYKPAASGCRLLDGRLVSDDAIALWEAAGRPGELDRVCPQRFVVPLAPHLAARAEGKQIDVQLLRDGLDYWRRRAEIVLVEGAGGLMSPLWDAGYVADLAEQFGLPLIVVARNSLGTINQTLQTLIVAGAPRRLGRAAAPLTVAGVVLNQPAPPAADDVSLATNRAELAARCPVPILAEAAFGRTAFDAAVDWFAMAKTTCRGRTTDNV